MGIERTTGLPNTAVPKWDCPGEDTREKDDHDRKGLGQAASDSDPE